MNTALYFSKLSKKLATVMLPFVAIISTQGFATALAPDGVSVALSSHYDASPPLLTNNTSPLVMLVLSNDHELFKKAYSDYSDLDNDGNLDTYYKDGFEYYGYFNSNKCYDYNGSTSTYQPNGDVTSGGHKCGNGNGEWSGNFLNWASMTRMDVVRKVLYGGKRSTDTTAGTVLERAMIPNDVHSYVKTVNNSTVSGSISDYTPFADTTISVCNTTLYTGSFSVSGSVSNEARSMPTATHPPLLRFARGEFPQWATSEVRQCLFSEEAGGSSSGSRPSTTNALNTGSVGGVIFNGSYAARVEVCVNGEDDTASYCREYTDASGVVTKKPIGLLQEYGEGEALRFGLMTGSYNNNIEGGVLRKNITQFAGGGSVDDEVDLNTGVFTNNTNSIVGTLDSMRIAGWDYGDAKYKDCNTYSISVSTFKTSTAGDRQCRDWGNPLSEIYLEALRYFSGTGAATPAFATDDSSYLSGMNQATWSASSLLDAATACSDCAIVVLSTGLNSFDADGLATASDLNGLSGSSDVVAWTKKVGDVEGNITGQNFIVGNANGATSSNVCTTKTLSGGTNGLGGVLGLCPEIPQMEGSYQIAGLAYYANNSDLWPSLTGTQNVKTYTVALAETLPSFEIEASGGNKVSFVPACQANTNGSASLAASGWDDCSLSDVTVVSETPTYGHLLFAWEDSHWGNDYDMDGIASIEYCTATGSASSVRSACPKYSNNGSDPDWGAASTGEIQFRVSVPVAAAGNALKFGFLMNGSSSDGVYINLLRPGGQTINRINSQTTGTILWDSIRKFTASASTGDLLENPLWYSAKYGSYEDSDGSGSPNLSAEWDSENNITGAAGGDGVPDSFFKVSDPSNLVTSLASIFSQVSGAASSSSSAAVVANTAGGIGAIYQAVYEPEVTDTNSRSVNWLGSVVSYFIDEKSRFREDQCSYNSGSCNKTLDATDPIIEFDFTASGEPVFNRIDPSDGTTVLTANVPFTAMDSLWNAADVLNTIADANLVNQRTYSVSAANGRYIKTWIDGLNGASQDNGVVDAGEFIDFDASSFNTTLTSTATATGYDSRRFLGFDSGLDEIGSDNYAVGLVNFIRGIDQPFTGWRSRQLDRHGSGVVTERMSDVIHSAPEVVGRPAADYDRRYADSTYLAYKNKWQNRRQMVYVGGNDGMLHAFNAGFFQAGTYQFALQNNGETAHPLGSELWAYIPQAVLPHLQWLKEENYPHVFYVDGSVEAFDVNIFDPSGSSTSTHPFGWGTILVVTMRLGGGDITIDPNSDITDADADGVADKTLRSAVMIFDVTDPESPPVLLAELSHAQLGYTTSKPTVIKYRPEDSGGSYASSNDKWVLVFGSGPAGSDASTKQAALDQGLSNQVARMYAVDISDYQNISWVDFDGTDSDIASPALSTEMNSYVGDLSAMDWDGDYQDDVVYFGTVGKSAGVDTGHLFRMRPPTSFAIQNSVFNYLLDGASVADDNQPFSSAPLPVLDSSGTAWVFAGAGRLLVGDDILTAQQLSFHGIIEPKNSAGALTYPTIDKDTLIDTTDFFVFTDGSVSDRSTPSTQGVNVEAVNGTSYGSAQTYGALRGIIPKSRGWFMNLGAEDSDPIKRQRNLLSPVRFSNLILFDEYTPSGEACSPNDGTSALIGLSIYTGTPSPDIVLATDPLVILNSSERVLSGLELGKGQLVGIAAHNKNIITQQGVKSETNSPNFSAYPFGRRSWREIPYEY